MTQALGLIEVIGYPTAIEAADAALKASNVQLAGITKVDGGIMTVQLFGDVGAITAAVEAGGRSAERVGEVRCAHVIPRVDESLIGKLIKGSIASKEQVTGNELAQKPEKPFSYEETEEVETSGQASELEEDITIKPDDNPEGVPVELATSGGVINLEEINKKSNSELRQLIEILGISVPNKKLKAAKKAELIRLITDFQK